MMKEPTVAMVIVFVDNAGMAAKPDELIPTRESLLSRIKNVEDRESWQDFFNTYWRLIYGIARKAGLSDAEAQDVVQETVLSVAKHIEGFRYDPAVCSFKRWMLQLTRWRIINQLKRREREQLLANDFGDHLPGIEDTSRTATTERISDPRGMDLESIWEEEWEKNLLSAAMERLKSKVDPEHLQVFDLYCIEQWPAKKVARTLGLNIGQVYVVRHRIARLLKKEVQLLSQTFS